MEPPRRYMVLAFLPVILALVTLVALYYYQQGAEARRESRQKPQEVLDALGIRAGMRVGEWRPEDTFFLERLARRVGPDGNVYAILPRPALAESMRVNLPQVEVLQDPPKDLDAVLLLLLHAADQDLEVLKNTLRLSYERLHSGGRFGLIGVGSKYVRGFIQADTAIEVSRTEGFSLVREEAFLQPQFFLILEKP